MTSSVRRFTLLLAALLALGGVPVSAQDQNPGQFPLPTAATPLVPPVEVIGGGPIVGDPDAVARIEAQIPDLGAVYDQQLASSALHYISTLLGVYPGLATAFGTLGQVGECALAYGVIGTRAYVRPDLLAAGAILVASDRQLRSAGSIALRCLLEKATSGGGALPDVFSPCAYAYRFATTTADGVADTYYVLVAGTNETVCRDIYQPHLDAGYQLELIDPSLF